MFVVIYIVNGKCSSVCDNMCGKNLLRITFPLETEKQKKLKEALRIAGLRTSVYWLAWLIVYMVMFIIISTLIVVLFKIPPGIMPKSNVVPLLLLFIMLGVAMLMFAFMLTPFFNKSAVAGPVTMLIVQLSVLLYGAVKLWDVPPIGYWGLSILGNVCFSLSLDRVLLLELRGEGLQWHNIADTVDGKFSVLSEHLSF